MKLDKDFFSENIKTLFYALIIAVIIRSLFVQPFYIPSSSMEEHLLLGYSLFVSKFTYGYSKHSLPFSPNISDKRIFPAIDITRSGTRREELLFKNENQNKEGKKPEDKFIWSYILRPVRRNNAFK